MILAGIGNIVNDVYEKVYLGNLDRDNSISIVKYADENIRQIAKCATNLQGTVEQATMEAFQSRLRETDEFNRFGVSIKPEERKYSFEDPDGDELSFLYVNGSSNGLVVQELEDSDEMNSAELKESYFRLHEVRFSFTSPLLFWGLPIPGTSRTKEDVVYRNPNV